MSKSSGAEAYKTALKYFWESARDICTKNEGGTYCLHDIFESVQADVARSVLHLRVHGHCETLADGGEDKRPFAAYKRHLHRDEGEDRSDDAGGVDNDVLLVSILDGTAAVGDVVSQEDKREESACQIEGPVVALKQVSMSEMEEVSCRTMYAIARSMNVKHCSLFAKTPFKRLNSLAMSLPTFLVISARVRGPSTLTSDALESISSSAANISSVNCGGGARLNLAILCRTSITSASFPLARRNFGDSWNVKTKKRRKKINKVTQPRTMTS